MTEAGPEPRASTANGDGTAREEPVETRRDDPAREEPAGTPGDDTTHEDLVGADGEPFAHSAASTTDSRWTSLHGRVSLSTVANAVGLLVLVAVVLPFALYAFPQLVGASHSYIVLSGSMEPAMSPGDAIIVESIDAAEIEEGDVITFKREAEGRPTTHRVETVEDGQNGPAFVTKGDANEDPDQELVDPAQVEGRIMSIGGHLLVLPYVGIVLQFAQTQTGFVLVFVLPVVLFLGNELYSFLAAAKASTRDDVPEEPQVAASLERSSDEATGAAEGELPGQTTTPNPETTPSTAETDSQSVEESASAGKADTYSVQASELRIGVGVLVGFACYALWVAYAVTEPWSVGVAAAIVMATALAGGLYAVGSSTTEDTAAGDTSDEATETNDTSGNTPADVETSWIGGDEPTASPQQDEIPGSPEPWFPIQDEPAVVDAAGEPDDEFVVDPETAAGLAELEPERNDPAWSVRRNDPEDHASLIGDSQSRDGTSAGVDPDRPGEDGRSRGGSDD